MVEFQCQNQLLSILLYNFNWVRAGPIFKGVKNEKIFFECVTSTSGHEAARGWGGSKSRCDV